jgi:peptidoglycan/xylan/chitin deacetylase (PgdA/CDA1 family)
VIRVRASFDDGSIYDLRLADMMNSYSIDTTFYIPVNWQRYLATKGIESLSPNDVKSLANNFTLGSHGVNHELLTRVGEDKQNTEILGSMLYWQEQGYNVQSFCYPRGYYDEEIKNKVIKAGYQSARTVKVGNLDPPVDPFETITTVHVGYDRDEYETDWLTYAKNKVLEAIEKGNAGEDVDYHFWGHSEEIHRYQQWDRLGQLLRFINENLLT